MRENREYEIKNLFGEKEIIFTSSPKKTRNLFDDYDGFISKFETKKTTDECFTPPKVYECVLRYVNEKFDLREYKIIRPFFPGGDYENAEYPSDCVVVDNPPFSIITKIARHYTSRGIKFFLFAPHMTLFAPLSCAGHITAIVCGSVITYENGAKVKTSFISNLFGSIRVIGVPDLYVRIQEIEDKKSVVRLPRYEYPQNVLTVSKMQRMVDHGISFQVDSSEAIFCRDLDEQRKYKKSIFGAGFLLSEKAAAEKAAAEKAAAEKAAAEKAAAEKKNTIEWKFSDREKKIIKSLN